MQIKLKVNWTQNGVVVFGERASKPTQSTEFSKTEIELLMQIFTCVYTTKSNSWTYFEEMISFSEKNE